MNKPRKSLLIILSMLVAPLFMNAAHFTTVWSGTAFNPMFFTVDKALLDGVDLTTGDEVAVFDGSLCVGAAVLTGPISLSSQLLFQASTDDGSGNGFTPGHDIIFKVWDSSAGQEYSFVVPTYQPGSQKVFTSLGAANASLFAATNGAYWTGGTSNTWNVSSNWNPTSIPTSSTTVVVPVGLTNYPTLSASGSCKDILLQADETGTTSILGTSNLTVSGNAYVETYISADQWHSISSPVGSQQTGVFYLNGNPKVFMVGFDENLNNFSYIWNTGVSLDDMTGYLLWVNSPPSSSDGRIFTYIGSLNDGLFGSTNNMANNNQGWNLVGNPYASAIDWDAAGWTKTNMDNAIYVRNGAVWASYVGGSGNNGGSQYIAPGQGFFVKVSSAGSGTLQMNNNVRLHNGVGFLKAGTYSSLVKISVSGNGYTDETVVRFIDESTSDFDSEFDAYKKYSTDTLVPQLYSFNDVDYSINSIPESLSVQLGIICGINGEYTIQQVDIENMNNVWLEDLKTAEKTDLTKDNYTFSYEAGENSNRFILHFTPLSIEENLPENINIFAYHSFVNVKSVDYQNGEVFVYNLLGQVVASDVMSNGICNIPINKQGYYLVKVITNKDSFTKKVFVD